MLFIDLVFLWVIIYSRSFDNTSATLPGSLPKYERSIWNADWERILWKANRCVSQYQNSYWTTYGTKFSIIRHYKRCINFYICTYMYVYTYVNFREFDYQCKHNAREILFWEFWTSQHYCILTGFTKSAICESNICKVSIMGHSSNLLLSQTHNNEVN